MSEPTIPEDECSGPASFEICPPPQPDAARKKISDRPSVGDGGSLQVDDVPELGDPPNQWRYLATEHGAPSALLMETCAAPDSPHSVVDHAHSMGPASTMQAKPERIYYLDWLRIMAVYLVVFYHCIQALDMVDLWTGVEKQHVVAFKSSSLQVGMPIFFHISGRAQALAKPHNLRTTLKIRFQRLLIPFVVGYFLLIPFWQYVQYRDGPGDHPKYFLPWLVWFFQPGHYIFHVGWLWFLPALFICGVFNAPQFLFAETRQYRYGIVTAACWLVLCVLLVSVGCPAPMMLMSALGPFCLAVVSMVVPFPPRNEGGWDAARWLAVQGSTLMEILSTIGVVCSFQYLDLPEAIKMVPGFLLLFNFYVHGYFVQRWAVGSTRTAPKPVRVNSFGAGAAWRHRLRLWTGVWQMLVVTVMILSLNIGSPVGEWEAELFPIYSASYRGSPFFGAAHVAGTWSMIGLIVAWFQAYANREINPTFYRHATSSTIVVYIFHWALIAPFVWWVCRDFDMMQKGWKFVDPILTLNVGVVGSLGIYALLLRYPAAGRLFGL